MAGKIGHHTKCVFVQCVNRMKLEMNFTNFTRPKKFIHIHSKYTLQICYGNCMILFYYNKTCTVHKTKKYFQAFL